MPTGVRQRGFSFYIVYGTDLSGPKYVLRANEDVKVNNFVKLRQTSYCD